MGQIGWFIVPLSAALGGIAVALLAPLAIGKSLAGLRTAQIRAQIGQTVPTKQAGWVPLVVGDLCRNGVRLFRPLANILLRHRAFNRMIRHIVWALRAYNESAHAQALTEVLLLSSSVSALLIWVLTGQVLLAITSTLVPFWLASLKAKQWRTLQERLLLEQLPDALRALGMCFAAGFSLMQAFEQTARESSQPLSGELTCAVHDMQTGRSVLESLTALDSRIDIPDFRFVVVAMEIQHNTGGSLREILDCAADSITAGFELARSLEVQTAQAKMSARVVSIMPLALMLVLSVAMEGYLQTFFSSAAGFMLLVCALTMEFVGVMAIRKILGIDLEQQ
ncbi:MAG: type II secretion system F family protein [Coriobacteriales bacterium]|jgi:tight adherence protein B|nr:type II secretion system F family protein [Coriobacteriales bacterium]